MFFVVVILAAWFWKLLPELMLISPASNEAMELIDEFTNPKKGKTSKCYRITYRSMDRSLTNEEIDGLQFKVRDETATLGCELR